MPALAVVGNDHQIIRSTETFRRRCEDAVALCKRTPELDLVLTGQTDAAVINLGEVRLAVEAVTDAAGRRQAMLSVPGEDLGADPQSPLAALREAADESAALVWVKDLDGRYLYINPRYERDLSTSEERVRGNTDADLPPVETVDGPRLKYAEDGLEEPLQLEYTVPAFETRPAMAALRFPLRNGSGQPIGTCGIAAPKNEAQLARDEAVRLMQLERWNRLDPHDVRAELLEQWHVRATPGPAPEQEPDRGRVESHPQEPSDSRPADEVQARSASVPESAQAQKAEVTEATIEIEAPSASAPDEREQPAADGASYSREDEWVRQLRQASSMVASDEVSETASLLQTDLQLARRWAERANQLQGDLQEVHARIHEAEADAQRASAAAELATEEAGRYRAALDQLRMELERERAEANAAQSEVEAARRELAALRAQAESLRDPADAAVRLSDELGRALAAERDRGDELARTLARVRSRLGDFEGALERNQPAGTQAA